MAEKVLTVKEIAEILQVNSAYVYELKAAGLIIGRYMRQFKVTESELDAFIRWSEGKDLRDPKNVIELKTGEIVTRFPAKARTV